MNLFIDTNVFLSFYHLSSDDLEELNKLSVLLERGEARLILPYQVRCEFQRNREAKIVDALKRFREVRLSSQYPQLCKDYPEYNRLLDLQREFDIAHKKLLQKITHDVDAHALKADSTIDRLMSVADEIPLTEHVLARARLRHDLGNPPGKRDTLGDAINWEAFLEVVPEWDDIHIVSEDGDYSSDLGNESIRPFLAHEWSRTKRGEAFYYRRLSGFFKKHFPAIKLASELEKDLAIRDLARSSSFAETHVIVSRLERFDSFSAAQSAALVDAALTNNQVIWIVRDTDVHEFFTRVLAAAGADLDPEKRAELERQMTPLETVAEVEEPLF